MDTISTSVNGVVIKMLKFETSIFWRCKKILGNATKLTLMPILYNAVIRLYSKTRIILDMCYSQYQKILLTVNSLSLRHAIFTYFRTHRHPEQNKFRYDMLWPAYVCHSSVLRKKPQLSISVRGRDRKKQILNLCRQICPSMAGSSRKRSQPSL